MSDSYHSTLIPGITAEHYDKKLAYRHILDRASEYRQIEGTLDHGHETYHTPYSIKYDGLDASAMAGLATGRVAGGNIEFRTHPKLQANYGRSEEKLAALRFLMSDEELAKSEYAQSVIAETERGPVAQTSIAQIQPHMTRPLSAYRDGVSKLPHRPTDPERPSYSLGAVWGESRVAEAAARARPRKVLTVEDVKRANTAIYYGGRKAPVMRLASMNSTRNYHERMMQSHLDLPDSMATIHERYNTIVW